MDVSTAALPCMSAVTLNRESISAYRVLMCKSSYGLKEWLEMKRDSALHTDLSFPTKCSFLSDVLQYAAQLQILF